jgi:putative acetyltransferase
LYQQGCDEHYFVHQLHAYKSYIRELTLVVEEQNAIIGHIIYMKSAVHYDNGQVLDTITFGPVTVDPSRQAKGIGSTLIKTSLAKAKELGYKGVIIMGHPFFYSRFGFQCSKRYNIKAEDGNYYIGSLAL